MLALRRAAVSARTLPSVARPAAAYLGPSQWIAIQRDSKWTAASSMNSRSFHASISRDAAAAAAKSKFAQKTAFKKPDTLTPEEQPVSTFRDLADMGLVSSKVIDVVTDEMGFNNMTDVQKLTINACLKGQDVYVLLQRLI